MSEALAWLEKFTTTPGVHLLKPMPASLGQTIRWMRQFNVR